MVPKVAKKAISKRKRPAKKRKIPAVKPKVIKPVEELKLDDLLQDGVQVDAAM